MSQLASSRSTILDVAKAMDPDGKIAKVAAVLQLYNDILDDIPWVEGNLPTGNQTTIQTSKAVPVFRLLNAGIVPTKSTTGQIVDACAIMENRNQIDVNVAQLNGNTEAFRMTQDTPMIAGFSDLLATTLIYGDSSVNPSQFNGLATRYFSLGSTYTTSAQLIDGGGTGVDNTSIWLVCWGEGMVNGIYPKGSQAGLQYKDLGITDYLSNATTGAILRVYSSWMQWLCGISVSDYRYVVRICNIDVSNLLTAGDASDTSANILKLMSRAIDLLPPGMNYRPVFYMNQTVRGMLRVKMQDKSNILLTLEQLSGGADNVTRRPVLTYQGIPCRRIDALTLTEAQITTATV